MTMQQPSGKALGAWKIRIWGSGVRNMPCMWQPHLNGNVSPLSLSNCTISSLVECNIFVDIKLISLTSSSLYVQSAKAL